MKANRPGCFENGEIDTNDAYQVEIICSWPALFRAPAEIAEQINQDAGFLKIATPGMPMNEWARRVNVYKGLGLIPGPIRQRDLWWDGLKITQLIDKLCRIMMYGTPDLQNLPGYNPRLPTALTCDAAGLCLLDGKQAGRTPQEALVGRVAHIDTLLTLESTSTRRRWDQIRTPATAARHGAELCGAENAPETVIQSKRIPDNGSCTIKARCPFCGRSIKVRGIHENGTPRREIDTQPICIHVRVRILLAPSDGSGGVELQVIHEQAPVKFKTMREAEADKGGTV